uniref:Protein kinase domain-containing protein n=1 Tax=Lactuca sativa TaxID=4236 RepID=A0A9R1X9S9_LACSA|nr:hypothetical protein LSAT_V11C600326100 [Lactuca sativa]
MGVVIPLLIIRFGILWYIKKRKSKRKVSESFKDINQLENNGGKGNDLLLFSIASIMAIVDDFSGRLRGGREIAIKRLSRTSTQGLVEFKNELVLIAKLHHTNLVRVLRCCIHSEEKMLIYEYMPNKSLDFFLFDMKYENGKTKLDWRKRFDIIEGIVQGLLYMHKYSRKRSMNTKISDFGMARIFKQNETAEITNRVYAMEGTFSIKSDIFRFGVLILEIVSGRRNSSFGHLGRTFNHIGYTWELWQQGDTLELKDPTLGNTFVVQQFLRVVHVALLCVQESAVDSPTTSDMISMLLNDAIPLATPNRPTFRACGSWPLPTDRDGGG